MTSSRFPGSRVVASDHLPRELWNPQWYLWPSAIRLQLRGQPRNGLRKQAHRIPLDIPCGHYRSQPCHLAMAASTHYRMENIRRQQDDRQAVEHQLKHVAPSCSPLVTISATTRALSSLLHVRRRPAPVNTSCRRTGSVIALCSVIVLSLTVKTNRRLADHGFIRKVTPEHRLHLKSHDSRNTPRQARRRSSDAYMAEAGITGSEAVFWTGLFRPKGTPREIVRRLEAEVRTAMQDPEIRQRL